MARTLSAGTNQPVFVADIWRPFYAIAAELP
jgi:hypothetical protein